MQAQAQKFVASAARMTLTECAQAISTIGKERSYLIQGHMGSGKTTMGKLVAKMTGYPLVYFDCASKSEGDVFIPYPVQFDGEVRVIRSLSHEELGLHLGRPIVLMLDEIGKNKSILNSLLRLLQERYNLHPGSVVFGTTNLGSENVGDMLLPHVRNRMIVVEMIKPTMEEWKVWAQENDVEPLLIGAINEVGKEQFFASFQDYQSPDENPYIYDPRDSSRQSFVTPRSLETMSDILKYRAVNGENITRMSCIGAVGPAAADALMTQIVAWDSLPKMDSIINNPDGTSIPNGVGANIVIANRCLQHTKQENFSSIFKFIKRMRMEYQSVYVRQVLTRDSLKWALGRLDFTEYATKNNMFYK